MKLNPYRSARAKQGSQTTRFTPHRSTAMASFRSIGASRVSVSTEARG